MLDLRPRLQHVLADRYRLGREIGRGGMAVVYLAQDLKHERDVALKVLRPELSAALGPERFLREIKVAAGLTHPHILPLHDSGEADGLLYYVMPYVQGESLRDRLQHKGPLPLDEALGIAREVADALDYAHRENIVHRDVKPENILLEAGHAVVADFGIARAISAAGGSRMTAVGIAVGTPDYMSPEQAAGSEDVDGRSDVFSLGVVLYEMLVGHLPPTGERGRDARTVTAERPGVPLEIELAIETAMAARREDRYRTAGALAQALSAPGVMTVSGARRRRARRRRWAGALAGAVALGAVAVAVWPRLFGAALDGSLYVVVPFGHREGAVPTLINGDRCEVLLYEALERWEDVRLRDRFVVVDAWSRRGVPRPNLADALSVARGLGAGRLIWGEVGEFGDTASVRAVLYDVRRREILRAHTVRFAATPPIIEGKFRELADSLLLGAGRSPAAAEEAPRTRVLAAWEADGAGHAALARWDLAGAERAFRDALASDPDYAHASLWLAQTEVWANRPASDWRPSAARALAGGARLSPSELVLAQALLRLADGQFPEACAGYRDLVARDSTDFVAWFGLGECQRRDRRVVRDRASPSGWRFRSSYRAAAAAYRRALELVPSVHRAFTGIATERLMRLFFVEPNVVRVGYAVAGDTLRFGAFPSLERDTLAFVAYPLAEVFGGKPEANPASTQAAVERNREVLREILRTWSRAYPGSADALESLGLVLETTGELAAGPSPEQSALTAVRTARGLTRDPEQALRLAANEVRLLVKLEQYEPVRALADSVLTTTSAEPGPVEARRLAGLAALTGRVYRTAQLLRLSAPIDTPTTWDGQELPDAPLAVKQVALELLGYAVLGAPAESLRVLKARVDQSVNSWVVRPVQERVRLAVLHVPVVLAFAQLGLTDVHRRDAVGNYLLERQWALAHGDTTAVRASIARIEALRATARPGDVSVDGTYNEALLLLQIGDTAAAIRLLDLTLDALPTLGTYLLEQTSQAGALVRAMALRADLAARAGDRATAARWARPVTVLWAKADSPLEPVLQRMRALADGEPR